MAHYNPEKRAWKGRSYKKGGKRVRKLREEAASSKHPSAREAQHMG